MKNVFNKFPLDIYLIYIIYGKLTLYLLSILQLKKETFVNQSTNMNSLMKHWVKKGD